MKKKQSQVQAILRYMKDGHRITPLDALRKFGCFRLPARISEIEQLGYLVKRRMIARRNHLGEVKHFKEYWIDD